MENTVRRGVVLHIYFISSKTHQLLVVDANRPWEYHW